MSRPSNEQPSRPPLGPWIGVALITLGGLGLLSAVIAVSHDRTAALISVVVGGVLTVSGVAFLGRPVR